MDFRHISKGLSQANKPHKNRSKFGGKVEVSIGLSWLIGLHSSITANVASI